MMEQRIVHVFVFDTLADWEPAFAIAGINNPLFQAHPGAYRVQTVGMTTQLVTTVGGLTIHPDRALADLDPAESAMLLLPGGMAWDMGKSMEAVEIAKAFVAADVAVAAICGATFGLARGGLLDTVQHTSNAREYLQATQYAGAAQYQQQLAVTDGNVITANSVGPIDFAYHIFKKLGLYAPETLDAWYGLFTTGDPIYFFKLQEAAMTQV
jgi:putative intracellular protease/amidase